jgi:hypothetical protein
MTLGRIFVYNKGTYPWNIWWNNRSATKCRITHAPAPATRRSSGDGYSRRTGFRELLTQRFDCGNIPIDDQYLFIGCFGEHKAAIRRTKLYSSLTLL